MIRNYKSFLLKHQTKDIKHIGISGILNQLRFWELFLVSLHSWTKF